MNEPTNLLPALLGLIWATWQISRRALSKQAKSKRHEELTTFINYLVGWAVLVGLILSVGEIPTPMNRYLAVTVSIVFTITMIWVYLGERISKHVRISPRPQRIGFLPAINFICALVTEPLSLYLFYRGAYLLGRYDELVVVTGIFDIPIPVLLSDIHNSLAVALVGVVQGMFSIAVAMYSWGLLYARKLLRTDIRTGTAES